MCTLKSWVTNREGGIVNVNYSTCLCQGLLYIHKSVFHSHGNVSSAHCRVDNRWTLKICCIIPPALCNINNGGGRVEDEDEAIRYRDWMWTAPELLRIKVTQGYL